MIPIVDILKDVCPVSSGKLKHSIEAVPTSEGFDILMYYYGRVLDDKTAWMTSQIPKIERTLEDAVEELLDRIAEE
jgi:hypothetical protein